jgi:3-hydroxypropanoate dehydrogenase
MAVYDLMRLGPTSGNISPARIVFVTGGEAKARLAPHLDEDNVPKMMAASATAIIGVDDAFHEFLPKLRPTRPNARAEMLKKSDAERRYLADQSGGLQAGYFSLAARALGLDCGPMGGFDHEGVEKEFFAGAPVRSLVLVNLGYGDEPDMRARAPRLAFDDACRIV